MGSPYGPPGTGDILGHPNLQLMYHHTVPNSRLKKFWNDTVSNSVMASKQQPLLLALERNISAYAGMIHPNGQLTQGDITAAITLSRKIRQGDVVHDPGAQERPDGWDDFRRIYIWLPGNLFKGPRNRADDPGDAFDSPARPVLGATLFGQLSDINTKIMDYLEHPADGPRAQSAYTALAEVAKSYINRNPRNFNNKYWAWKKDDRKEGPVINRRTGHLPRS
ncbi:hypothetical protein O1L68_00315 [Streptomyces lydicus]|nr:hypothetical protein [Streptomyces lydicus]